MLGVRRSDAGLAAALIVLIALVVAGCAGAGATAAPGLRYAVFLGQMVAASQSVESTLTELVGGGAGAGPAPSAEKIRASAESIAALASDQRAWLEENPPADCYAEAHHAAATIVESLSDASTAAIGWADAMESPELSDPATAYATFTESAGRVRSEAEALQAAMDATTCLD